MIILYYSHSYYYSVSFLLLFCHLYKTIHSTYIYFFLKFFGYDFSTQWFVQKPLSWPRKSVEAQGTIVDDELLECLTPKAGNRRRWAAGGVGLSWFGYWKSKKMWFCVGFWMLFAGWAKQLKYGCTVRDPTKYLQSLRQMLRTSVTTCCHEILLELFFEWWNWSTKICVLIN